MNFLNSIPADLFEMIGIFAGLSAFFVVLLQVKKELSLKAPSSLSLFFVFGWVFIYFFWGIYGLRFNNIALWLTNGIALIIQISLCVIVLYKNKQYANNNS